jgi:hypothetical protein
MSLYKLKKMYLEDFQKAIDKIESLKPNSRKQYREKLTKLCREFKQEPYYILSNPEITYNWICGKNDEGKDRYAINMRKAIVCSVQMLFKHLPHLTSKVAQRHKSAWKQYTMDISEQGKKIKYSNELSDKEKETFVEWNVVLQKRDFYAEKDF